MKAGIGADKMRQQLQEKLEKLDTKIKALEAGIEPYRREREMVMEMLAVHGRHCAALDSEGDGLPAGEPPAMGRRKP